MTHDRLGHNRDGNSDATPALELKKFMMEIESKEVGELNKSLHL